MKIKKGDAGEFNPFFSGSLIKGRMETKAKLRIVSFRAVTGMKFSNFILAVRYKGLTWDMGLKDNTPRLNMLIDMFGEETDNWKGQTFTVVKRLWQDKIVFGIERSERSARTERSERPEPSKKAKTPRRAETPRKAKTPKKARNSKATTSTLDPLDPEYDPESIPY